MRVQIASWLFNYVVSDKSLWGSAAGPISSSVKEGYSSHFSYQPQTILAKMETLSTFYKVI